MNLFFWYLNTLSGFYYNYTWYNPIGLGEVSKVWLYLSNILFLFLGLSFHNWYVSKVETKYQERLNLVQQDKRTYVSYWGFLADWVKLSEDVIRYLIYAKILMLGSYFYPSTNLLIETISTCREISLNKFLDLSWFYQSSLTFVIVTLLNQTFKNDSYYYLYWVVAELCTVIYSKLTGQRILTGNLFSLPGFLKCLILVDKSKKTIPNSIYWSGIALEILVSCLTASLYQDCFEKVGLTQVAAGSSSMINFLKKLELKIQGMTLDAKVISAIFNLSRVYWWVKLVQAKNRSSEYEIREEFNKESKNVKYDFLFLHQLGKSNGALLKLFKSYSRTALLLGLKVAVYLLTSLWIRLIIQGNLTACQKVWTYLDCTWLTLTLFKYIYKIVVTHLPI